MSQERSITVYREGRSTIIPRFRLEEFLGYGYTVKEDVAPAPQPLTEAPPADFTPAALLTDEDRDVVELAVSDLRRVRSAHLDAILAKLGVDAPAGANKREKLELIQGAM